MNKKLVLSIILIIIVLASASYIFYRNSTGKIEVYAAKDFAKETTTPIIIITDKKDFTDISTAISNAHRLDGIVNVAAPRFIVEVHKFGRSTRTIYLLLNKESINSMFLDKSNTNIAYSISLEDTELLKNILILSQE